MAEKILVVDDEPAVAAVMADALREAGYEPDTRTDSVAALSLLSAIAYDLIVSDIAMPGLTGIQLLTLIKAQTPSPAVILITGFSTRELARSALEHGAFAYVEKPFDTADLVERAKQALWKRRLSQTSKQKT